MPYLHEGLRVLHVVAAINVGCEVSRLAFTASKSVDEWVRFAIWNFWQFLRVLWKVIDILYSR